MLSDEVDRLTRAAEYKGLSINDFIHAAIERAIENAREEYRRGTPATALSRPIRREGLRRRPITVSLSSTYFSALTDALPNKIARNDFVRRAILAEIAHPTTNIDPDSGRRECLFHVLLTDDEMVALDSARTRRELKRSVFVRVAISHLLSQRNSPVNR
jgi:hypothetical protein